MTRLRLTLSCLMMIIVVLAVDFGVLLLLRGPGTRVPLVAMPMADVLGVVLAITVARLRRRGEVPLSHVMFVLAGGMTLVLLVYLVRLKPELVDEYLRYTAGRPGGGHPLFQVLRGCVAVSVAILVPALLAGWTTRGYRLKLATETEA